MTPNHQIDILIRFARIIAADGHDLGLQPVQWQALRFLDGANRFSRTAKGLTAWLGQTKGSVSQTLITLEGKGLITRDIDATDARVVRLNLTQAGCDLVAQAQGGLASRMLDHLPIESQARFVSFVETVLRVELENGGGRAFGLCRDCRHFRRDHLSEGQHFCGLLQVELNTLDGTKMCIEQNPLQHDAR